MDITKIRILKLATGEDIIAEFLAGDVKSTLTNPLKILVIPNRANPTQPQVVLTPWAPYTPQKVINVDSSHIVAIMDPLKDFLDQYQSMFSTLVMPGASKLVV